MLQLCGSYLSQGGSEQIGANGTARVCSMSQHAAEPWAPHHKTLAGLRSNLFHVGMLNPFYSYNKSQRFVFSS